MTRDISRGLAATAELLVCYVTIKRVRNATCRHVAAVLDVDECQDVVNVCVNADCYNTPGSFRCECFMPGTSLDPTGRVCVGMLR